MDYRKTGAWTDCCVQSPCAGFLRFHFLFKLRYGIHSYRQLTPFSQNLQILFPVNPISEFLRYISQSFQTFENHLSPFCGLPTYFKKRTKSGYTSSSLVPTVLRKMVCAPSSIDSCGSSLQIFFWVYQYFLCPSGSKSQMKIT